MAHWSNRSLESPDDKWDEMQGQMGVMQADHSKTVHYAVIWYSLILTCRPLVKVKTDG